MFLILLILSHYIIINVQANRPFPDAHITATFSLIGNTGHGCAEELSHTLSDADKSLTASVDGALCGANTPLIHNASAPASPISNPNIRTSRILQAAQSVPSIIAYDNSRRACGNTRWYGAGTVTALLSPNVHIALTPGLVLPPGIWAVVTDPRRIGFCLYKAATSAAAVTPNNDASTPRTDTLSKTQSNANKSRNTPKCFPASSTALRPDGTPVRMDKLKVGDLVRSRSASVTTVFMFTHEDPYAVSDFVRIETESSHVLTLTPEHALYVNGRLKTANDVQIGDSLLTQNSSTVRVLEIQRAVRTGLYNPQTMDGEIVIDGILVSTYTQAIQHNAAHAILAPLRAAFSCFTLSSSLSTKWNKAITTIL